MRLPRLRSDFQYRSVPSDGGAVVLALGESRSVMIEDPCCCALVDLLDGSRGLGEIATLVDERFTILDITAALRRLKGLGLLTDGPAHADAGLSAAWDAREVRPLEAEGIASRTQVRLWDLDSPVLETVARTLEATGLRTVVTRPLDELTTGETSEAHSPALWIAVTETVLDPRLAALNAAALEADRSWVLMRPQGNVMLLGPHVVPGTTGCWECLRQRFTENEQIESFLAAKDPRVPRPHSARAALPAAAMTVASLLAPEISVIALTGASPRLTGTLLSLDTRTWEAEQHPLIRQPQCRACGDPEITRRTPGPGLLDDGDDQLGIGMDGGVRVISARSTYDRVQKHVSRYLGVVSRLAPMDTTENGITFSYGAGHNFAMPLNPTNLRRNLRGQSGGKGRTELQAKVSAIGEAIERYSGVWRDDRPVVRASREDLGIEQCVDLAALAQFSDTQYADRDRTNALGSMFHRVTTPLESDEVIDWTPAWSLTTESIRHVPAAYCWYGHPEVRAKDLCLTDSNGAAAGNTRAEAVLQGFCELVERDSVALWWYHRSLMPGVDLDSFEDPWIAGQIRYYRENLGRDIWALDLTADLGIPTFAAVSRLRQGEPEDVLVGFGAHLDPALALGRALTELNQFLPSVVRTTGSNGRSSYAIDDEETIAWLTTVRLAEQPWLVADPNAPTTTAATHSPLGSGSLLEDVATCVKLAAQAGLEILVVDQSRPELELAVVKVIVPGLRHFWRRLGPGRLWDVPAKLGRYPLAQNESQLNPYSVFF